jgi:hypothetical protein
MKALIIENDYTIPGELKGFIKDYDKFTTIREEVACKHRKLEDLARFLPEAEVLIIMSTFLDKYQLEEFVKALSSEVFGKKKYFIDNLTYHLNNWLDDKNSHLYFDDFEYFINAVKNMVANQEVYEITEDDSKKAIDNYWKGCSQIFSNPDEIRERYKYIAVKVEFNKKLNKFITKK